MVSTPMEMFLDYSLRHKIDSIVINANEIRSQQSDLNVFFITNKFKKENDHLISNKLTTETTFFIRFTDEAGDINFKMIKSAHFGNIIESDFETMSFYPTEMSDYANYYKGNEVPDEGGWLYFAYCPFGTNIIELLNGDVVKFCGGEGKIFITKEQGGLKGYKQIPKVSELFAMGPYKILKLVIHSKWEPYAPQAYSMDLFAPDMKEVADQDYKTISIDNDFLVYIRADKYKAGDTQPLLENLVEKKYDIPFNASIADDSPIVGITKHLSFNKSSYINLQTYSQKLKDEFTIHMNFAVNSYADKGTILFEGAYGIDSYGNQTHHLTIFLDHNGFICYNAQYNDEHINTQVKVDLNTYTTLTFVNANTKILKEDDNEYAGFIFYNGRQIWPKETYLNPDEKEILVRAYKAYQTYTKVCLNLEINSSSVGAIDAKSICIKKLLKESGFVNTDLLQQVYNLWLRRPKPTSVDLGIIEIGKSDNTIIQKFMVGQDSYEDMLDNEYYFDGEIYDFALINRALTRSEIDKVALFNAIGYPSFEEE